jgi:hypothetical protein
MESGVKCARCLTSCNHSNRELKFSFKINWKCFILLVLIPSKMNSIIIGSVSMFMPKIYYLCLFLVVGIRNFILNLWKLPSLIWRITKYIYPISKRFYIFYYTGDVSLILICKSPLFEKKRVGSFWCILWIANIWVNPLLLKSVIDEWPSPCSGGSVRMLWM